MLHIQLHNVSVLHVKLYEKITSKKKLISFLLFIDRTYLRDIDQEDSNSFLPLDVSLSNGHRLILIDSNLMRFSFRFIQLIIQSVVSLFLIIYGLLHVVADFKEIRATIDLQAKSWETLSNTPSFYVFNHRGKNLSREARIDDDVLDEIDK